MFAGDFSRPGAARMPDDDPLRHGVSDDNVSIMDIIPSLWAHKVAIAVGLVIGLLLAYPATLLVSDRINRRADITIYPTGTPTDTAEDIQFQLITLLGRKGFPAKASPGSGIVVLMPYNAGDAAAGQSRLTQFSQTVNDFRTALLDKVSDAYAAFQKRDHAGQGNAAIDLSFRSFQDGASDGAIDPIRVTIAETDRRGTWRFAAALGTTILGAVGGLLVSTMRERWLSLAK